MGTGGKGNLAFDRLCIPCMTEQVCFKDAKDVFDEEQWRVPDADSDDDSTVMAAMTAILALCPTTGIAMDVTCSSNAW